LPFSPKTLTKIPVSKQQDGPLVAFFQTILRRDMRDLKDEAISTREEIQALRRDVLRQERGLAAMQLDMDRVKTRLDLQDNPPS
jgi:hypothetical protein